MGFLSKLAGFAIPGPSWLYSILAVVLVGGGLIAYGVVWGMNMEQDKQASAALEMAEKARKQQKESDDRILARERLSFKEALQSATHHQRIREIIRYEKPDSDCNLSTFWVRLHDSSATGSNPPDAGFHERADSGTTADQALAVIDKNYEACHELKRMVIDCRAWADEVVQANKPMR